MCTFFKNIGAYNSLRFLREKKKEKASAKTRFILKCAIYH